MRRNAARLAVCVSIMSLTLGCSIFGKKAAKSSGDATAYGDLYPSSTADPYVIPPSDQAYQPEPYSTLASNVPSEPTYDPAPAQGPRYHTVAKKETLYSLARKYYGDHHRWKDIYEANRASISDPNKIRVGQRLLIPE